MRPSRGATALSGVVPVDKPSGITSHDVVSAMRSATGERRIGHAGTLDPMATGLLFLLVGRATRLERYLVGHEKRYEARIVFGSTTDTLDAEGAVTQELPVPEAVFDPQTARAVLRRFLGRHEQLPPAYSAIKKDGVPSYRLARAGGSPDLAPRPVEVSEALLRATDPTARTWDVTFTVSSGTYVRALARDIGLAAGTVAHLGALRRTRIGSFDVSSARTMEEALQLARKGGFQRLTTDPLSLLEMPEVPADPALVRDGRPLAFPSATLTPGVRVAVTGGGRLLAVYRSSGTRLAAESVFFPGIAR
ncbi:MAG: tRNA pseudouridine(55) synthase TruB [Coriobacteriia bacterium]